MSVPLPGEDAPLIPLDRRLDQTYRSHGGAEALVCGEERWTYADLALRARSIAADLGTRGVGVGDRVAIDLGNSADAVAAIHGTILRRAAFTCIDATSPASKVRAVLEDLDPKVVFSNSRRLEADPSLRDRFEVIETPAAPAVHAVTIDPGDVGTRSIANIVYTSGSTGDQKGVVMTQGSVQAAADAILDYLGLDDRDRILCVLPLSFDYGLYQLLMAHLVGACLVLQDGVAFPADLLELLDRERITVLPAVPTLFALLLRMKSFQAESFPHLRMMTNTGAAVPVDQVREIRRRFPDRQLFLMYGLTECKRVSYLPPDLTDAHPDSVGIPMKGCEVAVVDENGLEVEPGRIGELVVRGPHLMQGYWKRPEATERRLRPRANADGTWLWTGDLFRRDETGLLFFVGRVDDVFKCSGEKVAPLEVERVLESHPSVREAAVAAQSDARRGTTIHAFVVPRGAETPDPPRLKNHCARHLEPRKVPRFVHVVDELPHTPHGKLDRRRVAEWLDHPPRPELAR